MGIASRVRSPAQIEVDISCIVKVAKPKVIMGVCLSKRLRGGRREGRREEECRRYVFIILYGIRRARGYTINGNGTSCFHGS